MFKPNFYKQYDSRWSDYSWHGDTIGASGCGATAIANAVSVLDKLKHTKATPKTVFQWLCKHGYFYPDQGTAWSGIPACLKKGYGVKSVTETTNRATVEKALKNNNFVVALMFKGLWTSGGHFVLAYYKDGYVYISDSASSAPIRQKNSFDTFYKQAGRFWIIDNTLSYVSKAKKNKAIPKYTLFVSDKVANVRKGRGSQYGIKAQLKRGKRLKLYSYADGWYKIYSGKYKGFYIHESTLSKYKPINQKYKTLETMNVRDGYATKNTKVLRTVKKGTVFKATKKRGRWVYSPKYKGWICIKDSNNNYLTLVK